MQKSSAAPRDHASAETSPARGQRRTTARVVAPQNCSDPEARDGALELPASAADSDMRQRSARAPPERSHEVK
jgi:hypothetical protein